MKETDLIQKLKGITIVFTGHYSQNILNLFFPGITTNATEFIYTTYTYQKDGFIHCK